MNLVGTEASPTAFHECIEMDGANISIGVYEKAFTIFDRSNKIPEGPAFQCVVTYPHVLVVVRRCSNE